MRGNRLPEGSGLTRPCQASKSARCRTTHTRQGLRQHTEGAAMERSRQAVAVSEGSARCSRVSWLFRKCSKPLRWVRYSGGVIPSSKHRAGQKTALNTALNTGQKKPLSCQFEQVSRFCFWVAARPWGQGAVPTTVALVVSCSHAARCWSGIWPGRPASHPQAVSRIGLDLR